MSQNLFTSLDLSEVFLSNSKEGCEVSTLRISGSWKRFYRRQLPKHESHRKNRMDEVTKLQSYKKASGKNRQRA